MYIHTCPDLQYAMATDMYAQIYSMLWPHTYMSRSTVCYVHMYIHACPNLQYDVHMYIHVCPDFIVLSLLTNITAIVSLQCSEIVDKLSLGDSECFH